MFHLCLYINQQKTYQISWEFVDNFDERRWYWCKLCSGDGFSGKCSRIQLNSKLLQAEDSKLEDDSEFKTKKWRIHTLPHNRDSIKFDEDKAKYICKRKFNINGCKFFINLKLHHLILLFFVGIHSDHISIKQIIIIKNESYAKIKFSW